MLITIPLYFFMLKYGKECMKNRQPYQLKSLLLLYNAFQALFSLFIFLSVAVSAYQLDYTLICQQIRYDVGTPGERVSIYF